MGQVPNPKNYRKDEKMRKRNIKINVFINEEEQVRFKDKVKKLGLSQSAYIRKIINEDMDNVIHKDKITPILEQIKVLNCDLVRARNFMIMNRIYNGKELLEKVLTEIRTLQDVLDKEQY